MYITINNIIGERTIDLSYPIHSKKEIAVVTMHISNSKILLHRYIEVLSIKGKKIVLKSQMLDSRNDIQRTNRLVNGTKITTSLK